VRRKAVVERSSRHSYYVLGVEGFDGSGEPVSSRSSWPEVPTTFTSWQISLGLGVGDGWGCCLLVCYERWIGSASRQTIGQENKKNKKKKKDRPTVILCDLLLVGIHRKSSSDRGDEKGEEVKRERERRTGGVAKDQAWVDIYTIPSCGRGDSTRLVT
jgi:hypothetical protein